MTQVSRYHPALVLLHWLIALLILGALVVGFFVLDDMSNTNPQKIDILRVHMVVGIAVLALMIVRLVVRLRTSHPPRATTRLALADRLAPLTHWGLYLVVFLMVVSGYATALLAGLPAIVFGHSGGSLPATFSTYPSFTVHSSVALILSALIALHVAAALYHQLVLKDGLFRRMAFGRRRA